MLNSDEHKISTAHKNNNAEKTFLAFRLSNDVFIMLTCISVKMPTNVGISTFKSMINFMLS